MTPDEAWSALSRHQRDRHEPGGFCRTCRDHWPCLPNAQALDVLAEVGTGEVEIRPTRTLPESAGSTTRGGSSLPGTQLPSPRPPSLPHLSTSSPLVRGPRLRTSG